MHPALRGIKARFQPAVRQLLATSPTPALTEAAFPAYAHRNPLVGHVFWKRLGVALDAARRHGGTSALDFGCGGGLMSEALAAVGFDVTALDLDLAPSRLLGMQRPFSEAITFVEGDLLATDLAPGTFDVIVALDVLEHVTPLDPYLSAFARLLRPGGIVIVSGPSENAFYRLGRRLAGKAFTGSYHVRGVAEVAAAARERFDLQPGVRIFWPATLFEVFCCRVPAA